jgi:hypothetical protein
MCKIFFEERIPNVNCLTGAIICYQSDKSSALSDAMEAKSFLQEKKKMSNLHIVITPGSHLKSGFFLPSGKYIHLSLTTKGDLVANNMVTI